MSAETLETMALQRKIRIHEPFAEFLRAQTEMHDFEISLLDCYRLSGHACHAITGAFLVTEAAIRRLFPEGACERGDLKVEFGTTLDEAATGPRSNVVSYITGAWAESGFPGLGGKFQRKSLVSYGHSELPRNGVRFHRLSTGKSVVVQYDPSAVISDLGPRREFPENWRFEIQAILQDPTRVIWFS
ncbi:MAG TPA: hypothetical protein PL182_11020 [Pseudobdellovibrionaceae bacterium]|nr:hypothetical protein [Pseudobdellovibrionaceae bacterium]